MMRKASDLQFIIFNITIAAYEVPLLPNFEEVDGEFRFTKMLKDFWDSYAEFTRTRYTIKVAEEGTWGTWEDGVGYTDGVLGMMQNNEANKAHYYVPIMFKNPPGVFTNVLKEETYHLVSIAPRTSTINNDLLIKLLVYEPTCWLLYFVLLFTFLCICDYLSNDQKLLNLLSRLKSIFFQMVQITFKQNPSINCRCEFMLLACSTVAILIAISGAAFNTNAITGTIGEQVNFLMDIVRLNKIPVFIEGESSHESFEAGTGKEFKEVYDHAKKFNTESQLSLSNAATSLQFTEYNCFNRVVLASIRGIKYCIKILELICSQASKRRLFAHISPPYHTTAILSLINPGKNVSIGTELIRRDGAFANAVFEGGIGQSNQRTTNYHSRTLMKRAMLLLDSQTDWPIQDDSSQVRPLNFSNFSLIFKLIIFLETFLILFNIFYCLLTKIVRCNQHNQSASAV